MKIFLVLVLSLSLILPYKVSAASYQMSDLSELDSTKCLYSVNVYVDTEGKDSNAADLIVEYNPNEVTIIDADKLTDGVQVITGVAYESYVYNNADNQLGKIKITAVRFDFLNGRELFAQIPFVSKVANPIFTIQFDGVDNTYDSNIAELTTSYDLLTSVQNIKVSPVNYQCSLTDAQTSSIYVDGFNKQVYGPVNVVSTVLISSVGTCLGLLLIYLLAFVSLKKRIRIVNKSGAPIGGFLVSIYAEKRLIKTYVSNKEGYFWINRFYLKYSIEITKEGFNPLVFVNGISGISKITTERRD